MLRAGRSTDRIGEEIVDGLQARGVAIAQPRQGDRSGLAGKDQQAVARSVTGHIDQHIDGGIGPGEPDRQTCQRARIATLGSELGEERAQPRNGV